jgi:hypothetical protein
MNSIIVFIVVICFTIMVGTLAMVAIATLPDEYFVRKPTHTEKKEEQRSPICVGVCMGPHINLNNGKLEMFSTGPGLNL